MRFTTWEWPISIIGIIGSIFALFEFTYKGWVEWRMHPQERGQIQSPEERKAGEKGKRYFFGGIGFTVVIVFFTLILNNYVGKELIIPVTPTPTPTPAPTPFDENYYIKSYSYNGAIYTGYLNRETDLPNGNGAMTYSNGDVYDGTWVNGMQNGQGKMTYQNGDTYTGSWEQGEKGGFGVYTWSDGKKYEGEYKNDRREGEGIFYGWSGYLSTYGYIGTYYGSNKDNRFEGYGKFEFANGDVFLGEFTEDQFWNGEYIKKDGGTYRITNGKPAGSN